MSIKNSNLFMLLCLVVCASVIMFNTSCKASFGLSKSADVLTDINVGAIKTDTMYAMIMRSPDKTFPTYLEQYIVISNIIDTLIIHDQARKNPNNVLQIDGFLKAALLKYETEHVSAGVANNAMLSLWRRYMKSYWTARGNAEKQIK